MTGREISLQLCLRRYWIGMFLFLIMVYLLLQSYMVRMLTESAEGNIQKSIYIASNGIEESLQIVDSFIYEALYSGTTQSASQLYHSLQNETDPVELATIRNTVVTSLQSIAAFSDMIDFIMIYTDREDEPAWLETGKDDNYRKRREVKQLMSEMFGRSAVQASLWEEAQETARLGRYIICRGEAQNYMLRLIKIESSYFIVGVSEEKLLSTLSFAAYDDSSISFAAQEDGTVIFQSEEFGGVLTPEQEGSYITINRKQYLQTGYVSELTGYYFGMLTDKNRITEQMWLFRVLFMIMFLVLLFIVPVSFYIIYRYVERPIENISHTMNKIAEDGSAVTMEESSEIIELAQLVRAFNHMIEQIKRLKIEKYEVKLEAQKATMQYLQLQIKPHFYANVLNIIYSCAERKDYVTIQRMSKAIVNYSRYMFRDTSELVELHREIEHVRYYMEIQEIRYVMQITCRIEVEEEIKSALIPPFIIQSFVENSVKYAFTTKKNCAIAIHVKADKAKEQLTIRICDNGDGYSEELLHLDWNRKNGDGHIGLTNVYRRLKLIYEDKARIQLQNDNGAVALIQIPYISVNDTDFE